MSRIKKATFAGGCFWCMVKPFYAFDGVISVTSGYTGGAIKYPSYEEVCRGDTGHYEAVEIVYEEDVVRYYELLEAFFMSIDPTDEGGQFNDRGSQYQTAVFYHDETQREIATQYKKMLSESGRFEKKIVTKILPAEVFYPAEEVHQDYYKKNHFRYRVYFEGSGRRRFLKETWKRGKEEQQQLRERLSEMAYKVTQENGTEPPFENEYNAHFEPGIYVDVVTKRPLFSSRDKFESGCGWPAFAKPINSAYVREKRDLSHGMFRTEVRSRIGDSHLGHVFSDGPIERGGMRYCINSAALEFIPESKMEELGYGEYLPFIKE